MADTSVLLDGLREYRTGLIARLDRLGEELQELEGARMALDGVFQGDAAESFRQTWQRTAERFRTYVEQGMLLAHGLDARISALEAGDAAEGGLQG